MAWSIPRNYDLFIGNRWQRSGSNATLDSLSPLTGEVLCTVPDANAGDVDAAVNAAAAAWRSWYEAGPRRRQAMLMAVADRLAADAERFAWLETSDTGKPWRESLANVHTAADRIRFYAGAIRAFEGKTLAPGGSVLS